MFFLVLVILIGSSCTNFINQCTILILEGVSTDHFYLHVISNSLSLISKRKEQFNEKMKDVEKRRILFNLYPKK